MVEPSGEIARSTAAVLALGGIAVGVLGWGVAAPMLSPPAEPEVTRFVVTAAPSDPVTVTLDAG